MFGLKKLFSKAGSQPSKHDAARLNDTIPTVAFDSSRVNEVVLAQVWDDLGLFPDIGKQHSEQVFVAAIEAVSAGRDLHHLSKAIMRSKACLSRARPE